MEYKNLKIKDWALEDRPREKLINRGLASMSDAELIAILLGSGQKNESVVEIARKVLSLAKNNLNQLGKLSSRDFKTIKGIGDAKAITLIAALELGRRRKETETVKRTKVSSSKDAYNYFHSFVEDLSYEEFWVLYLNRSNKVIERKKISQGGVAGTVIDIRIILKYAIENLASSLIICHNHPSGNLQPSEADSRITAKLKKAAGYHDIQLLDHLIIADKEYFSFADKGEL